jgi:hypothetical protein
MLDLLRKILDLITGFPNWIFSIFKAIIGSLYLILVDVFCAVLDGLMGAVVALVATIPVPQNLFNANDYMSGLPGQMLGMFGAIQLPVCFAMLLSALTIRFIMGLVPFIRLGR